MLACLQITAPLEGDDFHIWRQTRTGLLSYPLEDNAARAHLAASIYLQMALKPHIVHIVGHSEAHHAATAQDIIDACRMARRAIENALSGQPDMTADLLVQSRKEELVNQAQVTLKAIANLNTNKGKDPYIHPGVLTHAVQAGILDAPHLMNNPFALGKIQTRIIKGKCMAVDASNNPINEEQRLANFLEA